MNANLQVLAEVRHTPAHGAILLPRCLSSWDFKAPDKQGLVLTVAAPWGWWQDDSFLLFMRELEWRKEP